MKRCNLPKKIKSRLRQWKGESMSTIDTVKTAVAIIKTSVEIVIKIKNEYEKGKKGK